MLKSNNANAILRKSKLRKRSDAVLLPMMGPNYRSNFLFYVEGCQKQVGNGNIASL